MSPADSSHKALIRTIPSEQRCISADRPGALTVISPRETEHLYDAVRTIHMNSRENPNAQPKTRLGYSVGRWEGDTLVVETGSVDAEYLVPGVPLGPSDSFVERFTPSADGNRLHYTIVITDPYSLTQPVEQKRSWVASNAQVLPYNCTPPGN
jgi:hypothetical protein